MVTLGTAQMLTLDVHFINMGRNIHNVLTMDSKMANFRITDSDGKVELLKRVRGVDLVEVKKILDAHDWLTYFDHSHIENQRVFVIAIKEYCYLIPVVLSDLTIKTAYPSRKYTKRYFTEKNK